MAEITESRSNLGMLWDATRGATDSASLAPFGTKSSSAGANAVQIADQSSGVVNLEFKQNIITDNNLGGKNNMTEGLKNINFTESAYNLLETVGTKSTDFFGSAFETAKAHKTVTGFSTYLSGKGVSSLGVAAIGTVGASLGISLAVDGIKNITHITKPGDVAVGIAELLAGVTLSIASAAVAYNALELSGVITRVV